MEKPITRERILRILTTQAAKTEQVIADLDEAALALPARDDGWTAKEVLAHIAAGHEGLLALAQGRVPGDVEADSFDLDRYNESMRRRSATMSLTDVLAWLERARAAVRAYVEAVDEVELEETVPAPFFGPNPRGKLLMFPALHEGGHRGELERWRAQLPLQIS